MTKRFYCVGVFFETSDESEAIVAGRWLTMHIVKMISDEVGCFKRPNHQTITDPADGTKGSLVIYEFRDEQSWDRYKAEWMDQMRKDPTRPTCIKVRFRYLSP